LGELIYAQKYEVKTILSNSQPNNLRLAAKIIKNYGVFFILRLWET